jgi:hypothetical protein
MANEDTIPTPITSGATDHPDAPQSGTPAPVQSPQAPPVPAGFSDAPPTAAPPLPAGASYTPPVAAPPLPAGASYTPPPPPEKPHDVTVQEYTAMSPDQQKAYAEHVRSGRSVFDPATGFIKGLGQTVNTLSGLISRAAPSLVRPQDVKAVGQMETQSNTMQQVGGVAEAIAEYFVGDEAVKSLSIAERLGLAAKVAKLAKSSPYISKIIEHGLMSLRGGVVAGGQTLAHGGTLLQAVENGAVATALGTGTGAVIEGVNAGIDKAKTLIPQLREGAGIAQPQIQSAVRTGLQQGVEETNAQAAARDAIRAPEPARVHPPEVDPTVHDPNLLNPFPGEDVKIQRFPAEELEAEEGQKPKMGKPSVRISGPGGSSIELELDGKTARVKGIINSGVKGDGQRLYDTAIDWAKESGYNSFEGDGVQTQDAKNAWQRIANRHVARMSEEGVPSIDLKPSRMAPEPPRVTPKVAAPSADTPLSAHAKDTIADAHVDALGQQKDFEYGKVDKVAGFDYKKMKDTLVANERKLAQIGNSNPDLAGRTIEDINDARDQIAKADAALKEAGISTDTADTINARWEDGHAIQADLRRAKLPNGDYDGKKLLTDARQMRNTRYGDRLARFFGSKDAADQYVLSLEKAVNDAQAAQHARRVAGVLTSAAVIGSGVLGKIFHVGAALAPALK